MKLNRRKWLKEIRLKHGYTQLDVARLCGISKTYYCDIENGRKDPSGVNALKISRLLGFNMEIFYADEVRESNKKAV